MGRFLEHDRIFYFHDNGHPKTFIGSADWRNRNLKRRVELITPVEEPGLSQYLIQVLAATLNDNRSAWELDADGQYWQHHPTNKESGQTFQEFMMKHVHKRAKAALQI